jgi:IS30 family transposase
MHAPLRLIVASKLEDNWSPEQIAGWLKRACPDDEASRVSHETIYRSLFVQASGALKKELRAHLRSGRAIRRSRYVMLAKVGNSDSRSVVSALIEQARSLPEQLWKTLAWDRGEEMAEHRRFTLETDVAVYFCDPQSPWQRGSNENTNRLLRQYFPKGTDLSVHSQERLNDVARQMNQRPRKTLDYETPAERFDACVAMTN